MKINAFSYAQMIKCIAHGPCTIQDVADYCGLHYLTCQRYLRELYRAKVIHIASWEKDVRGRDLTRVYEFGTAKDSPRASLSDAQRQARRRKKIRDMRMQMVLQGVARYVQAKNGRLRFEIVADNAEVRG